MNWFLENPQKLAAAELQLCKLKLFKAEAGKAWAETMIEYNIRRIKELEHYLGLHAATESANFPALADSVSAFQKACKDASFPSFEVTVPTSDLKGKL